MSQFQFGGYMLFWWVILMFRGVICCSGGLYLVTGGKQSQLLVHLTWTRLLDLDWSLTITKKTTTTTHHRKLNVSNISAVNGPNFNDRFLGPSLTNANCDGDIWQGGICPGDIDVYKSRISQLILTWFLPNFWTHVFGGLSFWGPKLFRTKLFLTPNIFLT